MHPIQQKGIVYSKGCIMHIAGVKKINVSRTAINNFFFSSFKVLRFISGQLGLFHSIGKHRSCGGGGGGGVTHRPALSRPPEFDMCALFPSLPDSSLHKLCFEKSNPASVLLKDCGQPSHGHQRHITVGEPHLGWYTIWNATVSFSVHDCSCLALWNQWAVPKYSNHAQMILQADSSKSRLKQMLKWIVK